MEDCLEGGSSPPRSPELKYFEPLTPTNRPSSTISSFRTPLSAQHDHSGAMKESIIVRVERPVVGIEFKPHILIRNKTNNLVERSERMLKFEYFRSKMKLKLDCYYPLCNRRRPLRSSTMECLFNNRRYCSVSCFKNAWKDYFSNTQLDRKRRLPKGLYLSEDSLEEKSLSNSEFFKRKPVFQRDFLFERENSRNPFSFDDLEWDLVSSENCYIPNEDDVGHVFKVRCTALLSPRSARARSTQDFDLDVAEEGQISSLGDSSVTEPVFMLPTRPPKREIISRRVITNGSQCSSTVTVLCYNILADIYTSRQVYPYCPLFLLNWKIRRRLITDEILHYSSDLICLQEVQNEHYQSWFHYVLEQKCNYRAVYKVKTRKDNNHTDQKVDGCYTLFKKERFKLVDNIEIEYNQKAMEIVSASVADEDTRSMMLGRLCKDNVAMITVLREKTTQEMFLVVNTHLHWDPEYADVKLWQAVVLMKEIDKAQKKICSRFQLQPSNLPVILCGDFNSRPTEAPIKFIKQEPLSKEDINDPLKILPPDILDLKSSVGLKSSYQDICGEEPSCTNLTKIFKGTLDYIFASENNVQPLRTLAVPSEDDLRGPQDTPLPNIRYPSDHVALFVELQLNYNYGANNTSFGYAPPVSPEGRSSRGAGYDSFLG